MTKTLQFEQRIDAPVAKVWDTMLAKDSYSQWTAPFTAGSYFEGNWEEGTRMRFLAPSGSGMVAEIAESRRHELLQIRHLGIVEDGVEDTTSAAVTSWAPALEVYRFESIDGGTVVRVEQEVPEDFEGTMQSSWPPALLELKRLCETD